MTTKYKDVYIADVSTVVGPYEAKGPLSKRFDRSYEDMYFGTDSLETAEVKLMTDSIDILLNKLKKDKSDIDLFIAGDLQNQIATSSYTAGKIKRPFLGIYSACATNTEGLIIASNFLESKTCDEIVVSVSSHNMVAEKQFRHPTEYGAPKPGTATFTATGGASCYLTTKKSKVRIASSTIGIVQDYDQNDPMDMGAVMAPAAAQTLMEHLKNLKIEPNFYDLILTGDLGRTGSKLFLEVLKHNNINLTNYQDAGSMLFKEEHFANSGSSGPVTLPLVVFNKIIQSKKYKKILLLATGALHSPTLVNQHEEIPAISHALSLEVL